MPLLWDEVNKDLDPKDFTIKNAVERMESLKRDPLLPVLEDKPNLGKVLEKLGGMLGEN
jgi:bifunctional non-homologous end joining protein LigD